MIYLRSAPPRVPSDYIGKTPFRAVVVVEAVVSNDWRNRVSEWLVESGCIYMLAWGLDCSKWDCAVDWAVLEKFQYKIPDEHDVWTTWHPKEELESVFFYAKRDAFDDHREIVETLVLHVSHEDRETEIRELYAAA